MMEMRSVNVRLACDRDAEQPMLNAALSFRDVEERILRELRSAPVLATAALPLYPRGVSDDVGLDDPT